MVVLSLNVSQQECYAWGQHIHANKLSICNLRSAVLVPYLVCTLTQMGAFLHSQTCSVGYAQQV